MLQVRMTVRHTDIFSTGTGQSTIAYWKYVSMLGRWIQPVMLGGYLAVKSHNGFATVRGMKYTSQDCCDKTMEDNMALYRECCFRIVKNHA